MTPAAQRENSISQRGGVCLAGRKSFFNPTLVTKIPYRMLLRCMNPQVIAVDEITAEADIRAMTMAANCGVGLLATIHAQDRAELEGKPLARMLLASGAFAQAIVIENRNGERTYRWEELAP